VDAPREGAHAADNPSDVVVRMEKVWLASNLDDRSACLSPRLTYSLRENPDPRRSSPGQSAHVR